MMMLSSSALVGVSVPGTKLYYHLPPLTLKLREHIIRFHRGHVLMDYHTCIAGNDAKSRRCGK